MTGKFSSPILMPLFVLTPSPSVTLTRITQVILTDLAAFRQQLVPYTHLQICDYQDEAVLKARLLQARSRTYYRTRDQYRARRGAPPKWRSTTLAWASHVWALPKASFQRRGTLLRTIWDQWWHGETKSVAGLLDTECLLCHASVCSQACPSVVHLRKDHFRSFATAYNRLPQGPQRQLLVQFLDIVTTWSPLDERVLLWTGMLTYHAPADNA